MASQAELLYKIQVDASDAVRQMEAVAGKIQGVSKEAANSSTGFKNMQMGVQNASYQLTDFITQVQGGQSALRAFGQQAPQLLGGFGAWGAAIGLASSALSVLLENTKLFETSAQKMKAASEQAATGVKMLKEAHRGLDDETIGAINNWAKAWQKASGEVRKELMLNLNLTLEVMKAEQTMLKAREDVDKGIAKGTTKENWYGGLLAGQSSIEDRQAALQRLNKGQALKDQIAAMEKFQNNPNSPLLKTESESKAEMSAYEKALSSLKAKQNELVESTKILANAQYDYLGASKQVTESEKAKLKLDEDIRNNVVKYTAAQKANLYSLLDSNIAIEKNNLLQAEANKVIEAARTPLDSYNASMQKYQLLLESGKISQAQFNDAVTKAQMTVAAADPMITGFGNAINNAFTNAAFGSQSFGNALSNLAIDMSKVVYQVLVLEPLIRALKQTMVSSGMFSVNPGQAAGGGANIIDNSTPYVPSANGNVFSGGISSGYSNVVPFASGGVVSSPTYFPMGGGKTGVAGEAGTEAIIPLKRGSDGKLGVDGGSMGGGGTIVNVYNQSGGEVETKQRKNSNGENVIDIMVKKAVADGFAKGDFDQSLNSIYGIRRQGSR